MTINLTMRHLRCFVAVARSGSFTQAAKRLFVTQSSLTTSIQQFEQAVGLKLFDRTTRRVVLTAAGANFLPVAERQVQDFSAAIADVRAVADRQRGHISIAAAPSVAVSILSPVVKQFSLTYPNISITVADGSSASVERRVVSNEADFGITSRWSEDPELEFEPLLRDWFGVVCRRDHPLAKLKSKVTWKQLRAQRYVGLAVETGIRAMLQSVPGLPAAVRTPQYEMSSTTLLEAMLSEGLGVSVLPALAGYLSPLDRLVFRELHAPRLAREICLITRRGRAMSPAAQGITEMIRRRLKSQELPPGVKAVAARTAGVQRARK
jgi:LysR family transcriptional regulator, carnitine catabolism transcriptional activator